MRQNMKYILVTILFLIPEILLAQSNERFQQEYFFGRVPSIRSEAMGQADVAVGGSVSSIFYNPASIGSIENQEIVISTSAPFYVLRESDYYFLGYARRINSRITAAFSVNRFAVGETTFDVTIGGQSFPLDTPSTTNYALSVAGQVAEGLVAGVNINMFRWKLFDDVSSVSALPLDIGAVYTRPLSSDGSTKREVRAGIGITNVLQTELTYSSPTDITESNTIPSIARIGVAYFLKRDIEIPRAGTAPLELITTAEFQDVLTNKLRTGVRVGAEALLYDVLAFRMGMFSHSLDDGGFENNKSRLSDFTYGFGLVVPIVKFTDGGFPVNAHVDYMALEQPPYTKQGTRLPNMRGFSVRLVWVANDGGNQ